MRWSCVILLFIPLYHVYCDLYGHTPRCSNNRLDGTGRARTTNNRIFDSQNNNRAGYNVGGPNDRKLTLTNIYNKARQMNGTGIRVEMEEKKGPLGKMKYYEGSVLHVTWTAQHQCGGENSKCEIILQYMCSDKLRDGINDARIPEKQNDCHIGEDGVNKNCDEDRRFGLHEDRRYYATCKNAQRNNLYTIDQRLRGSTAKYTRQNRNGNRNGYECPEERDYYPYWRPTPWIDIAVMTNNVTRCAEYKQQSENVVPRYYCKVPEEVMQQLIMSMEGGHHNMHGNKKIPITEEECKKFGQSAQWVQDSRPTYPEPECLPSPRSRDNHHGNGPDGFFNSYKWRLPNMPHKHCVLRMRYNITTLETDWSSQQYAVIPQMKAAYNPNLRCKGQTKCCTYRTPCDAGEGYCRKHYDCAAGLVCGINNGLRTTYEDVCEPAKCPQLNIDYRTGAIYEGPYGYGISKNSWQECQKSCEDFAKCLAWTYDSRRKKCFVKGHFYKFGRRKMSHYISGLKGCNASKTADIVSLLDCYRGCGQKGGSCPGVCGTNGYCCRYGYISCHEELQAVAPANYHACVKFLGAPPATTPIPDHCALMNVYIRGAARKTVDNVASWHHCLAICQREEICYGWTYVTENFGREGDRKKCELHDQTYKEKEKTYPGFISGSKWCKANKVTIRCNGKSRCCSELSPCKYGEGYCHNHNQCKGALICGHLNCAFGRFRLSCCTVNKVASLIGGDPVKLKQRGFVLKNDPKVKPLELYDGEEDVGKLLELQLALDTAQTGRTFQDRTHEFSILERPEELKNKKIYNMEVRGKRGNIVQVYPATDYDYSPNRLEVKQNDYVHIQWTGSERNPSGNEGNGRRGYDRNNMILSKNGHWGNSYPAEVRNNNGKILFGLSLEDRQKLALSDNLPLLPTSELLSSKDAIRRDSFRHANGFKLSLTCGDGEEIRIVSAQYGGCASGATDGLCSKCTGLNSMKTLKKECDGEQDCIYLAGGGKFGVNCQSLGVMQVSYKCLKGEGRNYTCGAFQRGKGKDLVKVGRQRGKACVEACWKRKFLIKEITGATTMNYTTDKGCWCDKNMQSPVIDRWSRFYRTCLLEKKGEPSVNLNSSTYRCKGQRGCCTDQTPCDLYEGDCDIDIQCKGRLVCGSDNCVWGGGKDCCIEPTYLKLDAAPHYFNLEPKQLSTIGEFQYMCSRNDDFSNRSQKGKIKVSNAVPETTEKDNPSNPKDSEVKDNMNEILEDLADLEGLLYEK